MERPKKHFMLWALEGTCDPSSPCKDHCVLFFTEGQKDIRACELLFRGGQEFQFILLVVDMAHALFVPHCA